jgi:general secretion pathway protein G
MARARTHARPPRRGAGFTLVELSITFAVAAALATIAIVQYFGYVEKARVARAAAEIESISRAIDALLTDEEAELPDSLADIEADHMLDPWGNPYQYLKIAGGLPPGMAGAPPALPAVAAPPGGGPGGGGPGGGPGGGGQPVIAQARKDQFLVPINSDYDLYSMGADGRSEPNLNSQERRDDVIRARDGAYVGLAEFF